MRTSTRLRSAHYVPLALFAVVTLIPTLQCNADFPSDIVAIFKEAKNGVGRFLEHSKAFKDPTVIAAGKDALKELKKFADLASIVQQVEAGETHPKWTPNGFFIGAVLEPLRTLRVRVTNLRPDNSWETQLKPAKISDQDVLQHDPAVMADVAASLLIIDRNINDVSKTIDALSNEISLIDKYNPGLHSYQDFLYAHQISEIYALEWLDADHVIMALADLRETCGLTKSAFEKGLRRLEAQKQSRSTLLDWMRRTEERDAKVKKRKDELQQLEQQASELAGKSTTMRDSQRTVDRQIAAAEANVAKADSDAAIAYENSPWRCPNGATYNNCTDHPENKANYLNFHENAIARAGMARQTVTNLRQRRREIDADLQRLNEESSRIENSMSAARKAIDDLTSQSETIRSQSQQAVADAKTAYLNADESFDRAKDLFLQRTDTLALVQKSRVITFLDNYASSGAAVAGSTPASRNPVRSVSVQPRNPIRG